MTTSLTKTHPVIVTETSLCTPSGAAQTVGLILTPQHRALPEDWIKPAKKEQTRSKKPNQATKTMKPRSNRPTRKNWTAAKETQL